MATKAIIVNLQPTEVRLVDAFIGKKKFKDMNAFTGYAVRRTIAELTLKDLDSTSLKKEIDEKELKRIQKVVKETRKKLWNEKYTEYE